MPLQIQLCYITDRLGLAPKPLLPQLQSAMQAGVNLVQLREKDLTTRELVELATAAVEASRGSETRIVINDRLDIAMAIGANGVHLGGHSVPVEVARRHVGKDFIIGASCHSLDQALAAEAGGADYILLGPVFDTPSKRRYGPPLGLDKLSEVARLLKIPVLALGGVTSDNVKMCLDAGATGIAGIRLFQECPSVQDRVVELRAQFLDSHRK